MATCLRLGLVHLDLTVVYRLAVQRTDGRLGSLMRGHLDEGKALSRPVSRSVMRLTASI
jgi:hypothetical protein